MFHTNWRTGTTPSPRCDSCNDVAVGAVVFFAADGRHEFNACNSCATDALTNCAPGARIRYRSRATRAEVSRGLLGGDAA